MAYLDITTHIIVVLSLGWYMITNLQWYNYKIERVILKHHKQSWHFLYFLTPYILYYILDIIYFNIFFYIIFTPLFLFWNKQLDKPLVLTMRVKRFLAILLFTTLSIDALVLASGNSNYGLFLPLFITYGIVTILEKIFFIQYKSKAKNHLKTFKNLQIIAITASYGKTSIKNYLAQVLSKKFNVYKTPRSVNTITGIIKDVNDDLPRNSDIYIAEAGAREQGDIEIITKFLEPQYAIIGSVGEQHIEYFKTLDNIIHTKMEILKSPKLKYAFVHKTVPILDYDTVLKFPNDLNIIKNDLDGLIFEINIEGKIEQFSTPILGSFNAINLTAVILMAYKLGMTLQEIKSELINLNQVEHRLHLSKVNSKIILDDSFNGNLEGMLEAVHISSTYNGRKIIVTPGIIESTKEANIEFAKAIDTVFDVIILTGELNTQIIKNSLNRIEPIILKDKSKLENILLKEGQSGDLILFSNDAPNFI